MKKLPVGQTIAEAYRFTFAGLEKVIGVTWLPIIVLTICSYFVAGPYLTAMASAMEADDATILLPAMSRLIGFAFLQVILVSVIGVAITREILAPLQRPLFLRFSLGGTELRAATGMLGLYVLVFLIAFACMIAGLMIGGSVPVPGLAAGQRAIGFAVVIAVILSPLLVYALVRLSFFIIPSVVMQGGFGLEGSWRLAKGNVGRIILVSLAVVVPIVIVAAVLQILVMGPGSVQPDAVGNGAAQARQAAQHLREQAGHLPLLKGLEFVLAPFLYGLSFSAAAFAFKSLTAPEPKQ